MSDMNCNDNLKSLSDFINNHFYSVDDAVPVKDTAKTDNTLDTWFRPDERVLQRILADRNTGIFNDIKDQIDSVIRFVDISVPMYGDLGANATEAQIASGKVERSTEVDTLVVHKGDDPELVVTLDLYKLIGVICDEVFPDDWFFTTLSVAMHGYACVDITPESLSRSGMTFVLEPFSFDTPGVVLSNGHGYVLRVFYDMGRRLCDGLFLRQNVDRRSDSNVKPSPSRIFPSVAHNERLVVCSCG